MNEEQLQIEQLQRQCEILKAERDLARTDRDRLITILAKIHECAYPVVINMENEHAIVLRPENPHEYMQALSDSIRAITEGKG